MSRWLVCGLVMVAVAAPVWGCDLPHSGEGFWYVVRSAAFLYDFTQDPPMVYGEVEIEVTRDEAIEQMCVICRPDAEDGRLQYAVIGEEQRQVAARLDAFDLKPGQWVDKGDDLIEFVMPFAPMPPHEEVKVYLQTPVTEIVDLSLSEGRVLTWMPSFAVPCDSLTVRFLTPGGTFFEPDKRDEPNVIQSRGYQMRGMFTSGDERRADENLAQALYMIGREDVELADAGYYYKTVEPQEQIRIAGRFKSVKEESTRRSLLVGLGVVAAAGALIAVWRLAGVSAGASEQEDVPT